MSIYEGMTEGSVEAEAPAAPATAEAKPPTTEAAAPAAGNSSLLAMGGGGSDASGKVYTARTVVEKFQSKEMTLGTAPRTLQVILGLVFLCMIVPVFAEKDYNIEFFLWWVLWIFLWGLTLCGALSFLAQELLTGREAKTTCGLDDMKPWLGLGLFGFVAAMFFGILFQDFQDDGWIAMVLTCSTVS